MFCKEGVVWGWPPPCDCWFLRRLVVCSPHCWCGVGDKKSIIEFCALIRVAKAVKRLVIRFNSLLFDVCFLAFTGCDGRLTFLMIPWPADSVCTPLKFTSRRHDFFDWYYQRAIPEKRWLRELPTWRVSRLRYFPDYEGLSHHFTLGLLTVAAAHRCQEKSLHLRCYRSLCTFFCMEWALRWAGNVRYNTWGRPRWRNGLLV